MKNKSIFLFDANLGENTESYLSSLLIESTNLAKLSLQNLANTSNFKNTFETAFGNNLSIDSLKDIYKKGQFIFPTIEIVSRTNINNANGAFSRENSKIYLAQEFLLANINNLDAVTNVVLEEYGHYLDSQLNITDMPGDEGAIFAALVQGKELSENELRQLKDEDDSAVVSLDGAEVAIEQNDPGDTLATAQNIGVLGGEKNLSNAINSGNAEDIYQFSLGQTSRVTLDLDGLTDQRSQRSVEMELIVDRNNNGLIDDDDELYGSSTDFFASAANITSTLGAANYFVRLSRDNDSTNTNYNFLNASAVAPSINLDPGKTLATAYNIGLLNEAQNVTEFVGTTDAEDIYQFSLGDRRVG